MNRTQAEDAALLTLMFEGPVADGAELYQSTARKAPGEFDADEFSQLWDGLVEQLLVEYDREAGKDGSWYVTLAAMERLAANADADGGPRALRSAALRQRADVLAARDIADAIRDCGVMWRGEMRGVRDAILTLAAAVRGIPPSPPPGDEDVRRELRDDDPPIGQSGAMVSEREYY